MKKNRILIYIMILIAIILCVPSITYLINNKTVDGFNSYYTYDLENWTNTQKGLISGIIVIGLLLIYSIIYFVVIKKENKIFKNNKQILICIIVISFIFMLILPYLSSDIYYYMGDSWIASKYGANPYYITVENLQNNGINDEILNNTGYWKNTVSVYGPLWNSIAKLLITLSFGSVTIGLFVFKIASYLLHILNAFIIYKITKSKKYMLIYGLNPLILIEFLSNVHNDIYLITCILLAIYFLVRKNNKYFTMIFLALSVAIKYSTVLLIPFVLIYIYRKYSVSKRILFCLISGLSMIALVVLLYLPYYRDFTVFTNMLVQGDRYSQSIMSFFMDNINQNNLFMTINSLRLPIFVIIYVVSISIILLKKENITLVEILREYNIVSLLFIFVVLTNFQKWYILWIIPTMIWQGKYMRKFILYLTTIALIPSMNYFIIGGDAYIYGITYSIKMLLYSGILVLIDICKDNIKKNKRRKNVTFSIN